MAQLAELGDEEQLQIFEGETLVNASNWIDLGLTQKAKFAPVHLIIRLKYDKIPHDLRFHN